MDGLTSGELIAPLESGIAAMKSDQDRFDKFNAPNGWGTRVQFIPWLEKLLVACRTRPLHRVRADV